MKTVQNSHFCRDFIFLKCILHTHKSVYEENLLRMHGAFQYYWLIKRNQLLAYTTTWINCTDIATRKKMDSNEYILYDSTYMKSRTIITNLWWLNSGSHHFWERIWLGRDTKELYWGSDNILYPILGGGYTAQFNCQNSSKLNT